LGNKVQWRDVNVRDLEGPDRPYGPQGGKAGLEKSLWYCSNTYLRGYCSVAAAAHLPKVGIRKEFDIRMVS
jgi:hypothetical protein